jgi:hypothetical protein
MKPKDEIVILSELAALRAEVADLGRYFRNLESFALNGLHQEYEAFWLSRIQEELEGLMIQGHRTQRAMKQLVEVVTSDA